MQFTDQILSHIHDNGKIIFMSSCCSRSGFANLPKNLKQRFTDENLTMKELMELKDEYLMDVEQGVYKKKGWGAWEYEVSKLFNEVGTKVFGRSQEVLGKAIQCYSCHPGILKTDMTKWMGNENLPPAEMGNRVVIGLIEREWKVDPKQQGGYFDEDGSFLELKANLGRKY